MSSIILQFQSGSKYFVNSRVDTSISSILEWIPGTDPGFQVRGGALKKIAPSGRRRENVWGISCEKSRFYAKKIIFFSNFRGGAHRMPPLTQSIYKPMMTANQASIYLPFCDLTFFATSGLQSHFAHCCSHYSNVAEQHLLRFNRCV